MSNNVRIVNSIGELKSFVSLTDAEVIRFKNLDIRFDIDIDSFSQLLGVEIDSENDLRLEINKEIVFENVKCHKLCIMNLHFTKRFAIYESEFSMLWINNCEFESFNIYNYETAINTTNLFNSDFKCNSNIRYSIKKEIKEFRVEGSTFHKSLDLSGLQIIRASEPLFYIAENTNINECLNISNSFITTKLTLICDVKRLELVNINNLDSNVFEFGELVIYKSHIKNILFRNCSFAAIDIEESFINDIQDCNLTFKRLRNNCATIFYKSPSIASNELLKEKYRAEFYDNLLKSNVVNFFSKVLNKNENGCRNNGMFAIINSISKFVLFFISALFSSKQFVLFLNKYSNDYNRSWIRGIFFTAITTLLFYFLLNYVGMEKQYFIVNGSFDNFNKVIDGYIYLWDIFKFTTVKVEFKLTTFGNIILFIAKVFIAYGCWQTISAFYKFRK